MAGVYAELRGFALAHRDCGELRGDADPLTPAGYRLWASCSCGARFERWVTPEDAGGQSAAVGAADVREL